MGLALGTGQSHLIAVLPGCVGSKVTGHPRVSGPCEGAGPRAAVTEVAKQDLARAHRSPEGQSRGPLAKGSGLGSLQYVG